MDKRQNESGKAGIAELIRAAESGNSTAQFDLGMRYLNGDGVAQSDRSAGDWFGQAALQDHAGAMREFGTLFQLGRGTERDLVQASELHMNAIRAGDAEAVERLAGYRGELTELALAGDREAAFRLCHLYDWGLGVAEDKALCWAWVRWARDGCASVPPEEEHSEDVDGEVDEAFRFFLAVLNEEVRRRGEAALAQLLADRGRTTSAFAQTILKVGAEDGSVALRGLWTAKGWRFLRAVRDWTPTLVDEAAIEHESDFVSSWRGALQLMDRYPWHRLTPLRVHPEFAGQVWSAYERRSREPGAAADPERRDEWRRMCER
jgi:hypothetical protein